MEKRSGTSGRKRALNVFKVILTVIFAAAAVYAVIRLMPWFISLKDADVRESFLEKIDSFGTWGVLVMLGIQFLQVMVAILPGEPIEVMFGIMYGTFGGMLLCLLGLLIGYVAIFFAVRRLYAGAAKERLEERLKSKHRKAFEFLRDTRKLELVYFILYFIPGTPKDLLTYIAPFTPVKPLHFFLIATFARIPSIITSTFAGDSLSEGEFMTALIVFIITGVLGILGIIFNKQITSLLGRAFRRGGKEESDMSFGEKIVGYREDIVRELSGLVRVKSVNDPETAREGRPFGDGPYNALQYALGLARKLGFKAVDLNGYMGYAEYGEGDEYIAIISHLDVVPEGEGWTHPPFGAEQADGRIYGRGVSDNKCAAILGLYAMKTLADAGIKPTRRIRLMFGCAEETGMEDIEYYFAHEPYPAFGFTPDSGYPIVNAEKGILSLWFAQDAGTDGKILSVESGSALNIVPKYCTAVLDASKLTAEELKLLETPGDRCSVAREGDRITVTATGEYSHGAHPQGGVNAIGLMAELLGGFSGDEGMVRFMRFIKENIGMEYYGESIGAAREDDISGKLTLNMGALHTVDGRARLGINIRYPVKVKGEDVLDSLKKAADKAGLDVEDVGDSAPLYVPADAPWIGKLAEAYETMTGEKAQTIAISGGTYSRYSGNTCVGFGGAGGNEHGVDEYVDIEELIRHGSIMTQAVYNLSQLD